MHSHELAHRDLGAQDVESALVSDLQEDVLRERVHREAGLGEVGVEPQPTRATAGLDV